MATAIVAAEHINDGLEEGGGCLKRLLHEGRMSFTEVAESKFASRELAAGTLKKYRAIVDHIKDVGQQIMGRPIEIGDINDQFLAEYRERSILPESNEKDECINEHHSDYGAVGLARLPAGITDSEADMAVEGEEEEEFENPLLRLDQPNPVPAAELKVPSKKKPGKTEDGPVASPVPAPSLRGYVTRAENGRSASLIAVAHPKRRFGSQRKLGRRLASAVPADASFVSMLVHRVHICSMNGEGAAHKSAKSTMARYKQQLLLRKDLRAAAKPAVKMLLSISKN